VVRAGGNHLLSETEARKMLEQGLRRKSRTSSGKSVGVVQVLMGARGRERGTGRETTRGIEKAAEGGSYFREPFPRVNFYIAAT